MSRQGKGGSGRKSGRGHNNWRKESYARGNAPVKSDPNYCDTGRQQDPKKRYLSTKEKDDKLKKSTPNEGIRLNKYIANSGVCSRREADTYISTGLVSVNGKVINEMGYRVQPGDDVRFDGRRLNPDPNVYVVLNKPKGFATTESNAKGMTVMDLVSGATTAKIRPFGRLGRNATGLLLFTNDDEFVQKFSKKGISRLFHVILDKNLKIEHLSKIEKGISIDGKTISVEKVEYVENAGKNEIGIKIKHTGHSVIRTIFDHLGYNVLQVDCVTLGPLTKKDLPRGRYRFLTDYELNIFKMI